MTEPVSTRRLMAGRLGDVEGRADRMKLELDAVHFSLIAVWGADAGLTQAERDHLEAQEPTMTYVLKAIDYMASDEWIKEYGARPDRPTVERLITGAHTMPYIKKRQRPPAVACMTCGNAGGLIQVSWPGEPDVGCGLVQPCPKCRPEQHARWQHDCYALDHACNALCPGATTEEP